MKIAWRIAVAGWMLSWLGAVPIKFHHYVGNYSEHPLSGPFFPGIFESSHVVFWLWLFPALAGVLGMVVCNRRYCTLHAVLTLVCSAVLMCHQIGFYAQAFVTSFWASLWLLWASRNLDGDTAVRRRAEFLAQAIISVVYLGAAVGKWTRGYWSGQVLRSVGVLKNNWFPELFGFPLFSRIVIVSETWLGFSWLFPARYAFPICILLFLGQWITTFATVIDALGPMLGLGAAGLWLTISDDYYESQALAAKAKLAEATEEAPDADIEGESSPEPSE